jgi:hypothetical protein
MRRSPRSPTPTPAKPAPTRDDGATLAAIALQHLLMLAAVLETFHRGTHPITTGAAHAARATSGLLRLWLLTLLEGDVTVDPDESQLRATFAQLITEFDAARASFETIRRLLGQAGYTL